MLCFIFIKISVEDVGPTTNVFFRLLLGSIILSIYLRSTGSKLPLASRVNFADAIDFTGWYINKTNKINGISKNDAYNQYLAYHEGHGGFKIKSYNNKEWLINTATKVDKRSKKYKQQLDQCKSQFKKKIFGIF